MIVTCEFCEKTYDDFDHLTFCPHEYFPPNDLAVRRIAQLGSSDRFWGNEFELDDRSIPLLNPIVHYDAPTVEEDEDTGPNVVGIFVMVLAAVLVALVSILIMLLMLFDAKSEEFDVHRYVCQLWAQNQTMFDYVQIPPPEAPILEEGLILLRLSDRFEHCMLLDSKFPSLETKRGEGGDDPQGDFVAALLALAIARAKEQGTAPATEARSSTWETACAAKWRTFDPSDGTVVRPRSKGGKVRCPLIDIDGEWVIP